MIPHHKMISPIHYMNSLPKKKLLFPDPFRPTIKIMKRYNGNHYLLTGIMNIG